MLDSDLAEIYGYETKNFNRQVKNNAKKFEGDEFMFRLTKIKKLLQNGLLQLPYEDALNLI